MAEKDAAGATDEPVNYNDKDVLFKFKTLGERQPGESWIQMAYGPSKAGKTFYAGTAGPRTLFINIGDGLDTLLSPAFTSRYSAKEMITVDIREQNPNGVAEAFDMVCNAIDHALKYFPDKFDNIVMDEATALRKYALNKAMELNTQARTNASNRKSRLEDYQRAEIGDFGVEMDMIEWFLAQYIPIFKQNNKHFLMLAHERQVFGKPAKIGDDAPLQKIMPGFTGKTFPDKVPAYFDDVFHAESLVDAAGNASYSLRTAGTKTQLAGARHGGIFQVLEPNPNYLQFLNRIKNAQARK